MIDNASHVPWTSTEGRYRFLKVQGDGVCEVPVGPIHAGIIEPGHFRFSVVGDTVLHLELRHFYTHKGTEKLSENTPVMDGVMIAESVSGDNSFSHAVAYCQAIESAFGISVPPRAQAVPPHRTRTGAHDSAHCGRRGVVRGCRIQRAGRVHRAH